MTATTVTSSHGNEAAAAAARQPTHRFLQLYSPVWMSVVGGIVLTKRYETLSGGDYIILGAALALPCYLGPAAIAGTVWPTDWSYHFKFNLWIGILVFLASWFFTHYFYMLLGVRYTLPTADIELNHVPVSMYLMAHPYFATYHWAAAELLELWSDRVGAGSGTSAVVAVVVMAYCTAFMEAFSIASFPGYTYPDREAMFRVGSLFYSLMFVVSFPMFAEFRNKAHRWTLWEVSVHSLGCTMLIFVLVECWRTMVGPISDQVDPTQCPPFTHPIDGTIAASQ